MPVSEPFPPLCPITGLPATRRIQQVSSALLIALWRASFGVSTARQLGAVERFGLWESPCGLAFFHPMIAGDEKFYRDFYRCLNKSVNNFFIFKFDLLFSRMNVDVHTGRIKINI